MRPRTWILWVVCVAAIPALAETPAWCGDGNYSESHPLAWERLELQARELVERQQIRAAYDVVLDAFDTEMMALPSSPEASVLRQALDQYLHYVLTPPGHELPAIFGSGPPNPLMNPPALQYELGPLGDGAPTAFAVTIPCPGLGPDGDPALRNVAYALWSLHRVATTGDFKNAVRVASLRSSRLYKSYEDYVMNGLPMWPWEMWINGFSVPDDFTRPAPKSQWVFLRPNVSPALVTGSESDAELDYGLTLDFGRIWYRSDDYSSWWGLSGMVALTDDEGVGYDQWHLLNFTVLKNNVLWRPLQVLCEVRYGSESGSTVREVL